MAKAPQALHESDAEYDWRMAIDNPDRYPFDAAKHPDFARRIVHQFLFWRKLGERTGNWRPFLRWAKSARLVD